MEIRFATRGLRDLYTSGKGMNRYPSEVLDAFFDLVVLIANAPDERDLRRLRGARLERLTGKPGCYSMRLNRQWRLELRFDSPGAQDKVVVILSISKHYGD